MQPFKSIGFDKIKGKLSDLASVSEEKVVLKVRGKEFTFLPGKLPTVETKLNLIKASEAVNYIKNIVTVSNEKASIKIGNSEITALPGKFPRVSGRVVRSQKAD